MGFHEMDATGIEQCYTFTKYPDNVKQVGQPRQKRIYYEDYVVTYLGQILQEKAEESIVLLVGKHGQGEVSDEIFLFGGMEVSLDITMWKKEMTQYRWEQLEEEVREYFPEGEILGWAIGLHMENDRVKQAIVGFHKRFFSRMESVLYCREISRNQESLWCLQRESLEPLNGYFIYYGKNPRMQEYVLAHKKQSSYETGYDDQVMKNVRRVIKQKEERKEEKKEERNHSYYIAAGVLALLTVLGVGMILNSNEKISSLEETIATLSDSTTVDNIDGRKMVSYEEATAFPSILPAVTPKKKQILKTQEPDSVQSEIGNRATATPKVTAAPVKTSAPVVAEENEVIPKESVAPTARIEAGAWGMEGQGDTSYVVQQGDTLGQILMREYQTTKWLQQVKDRNQIADENQIEVGQRIILPDYEK